MTMDVGTIHVPISELTGSITVVVTVKGLRAFNMRVWLGIQIMKLAALVLPFETRVEVN